MLVINDKWERLFDQDIVSDLEALLPSALSSARWYGGKARTVTAVRIKEAVPLPTGSDSMFVVFITVTYKDEDQDFVYTMILTASFGERALKMQQAHPQAVLAEMMIAGRNGDQRGILHDALWDDHAGSLLRVICQEHVCEGKHGKLLSSSGQDVSTILQEAAAAKSSVMQGEQSNTSVRFGRHVILKLYRRFESGLNPDLEIGRVLTARGYACSPAVLGSLEYAASNQQPGTVAIAQAFIENRGDAWQYTLDELERELTTQLDRTADARNGYADWAALLGRRTAELHLVLAQDTDDLNFAPEPASKDYWVSLHNRMTRSFAGACALLRARLDDLSAEPRRAAVAVLKLEDTLASRARALVEHNPRALLIRCHGDFHLGQVLYTGRDFVLIDFEGEPARTLAERRAKHVPTLDVAGMIRSFHYAAYAVLDRMRSRLGPDQKLSELEHQVNQWYRTAAAGFLSGYSETAGNASFVLDCPQDRAMVLDAYLMEKACYELSYELNNRPGWVGIPLSGLLQLLQPQ